MLLMFDNFYDVEKKARAGKTHAHKVMTSWAEAKRSLSRPPPAEKNDRYRVQGHWLVKPILILIAGLDAW